MEIGDASKSETVQSAREYHTFHVVFKVENELLHLMRLLMPVNNPVPMTAQMLEVEQMDVRVFEMPCRFFDSHVEAHAGIRSR